MKETSSNHGQVDGPPRVEHRPVVITCFTDEQREFLTDGGYYIHAHPLSGRSIKELQMSGMRVINDWRHDKPLHDIDELPSRASDVATLAGLPGPSDLSDPLKLFLPDSNSKTLSEQLEMVALLSESLVPKDLMAIIGEAPDYVELAHNFFVETGKRLFGDQYARTNTKVRASHARVGYFFDPIGIDVGRRRSGTRCRDVWAVPLIVPRVS